MAMHGNGKQRSAGPTTVSPWLAICLGALAPLMAAAASPPAQLPSELPAMGAPVAAYGPWVHGNHGRPNADDVARVAERLRRHGRLSLALQWSLRARRLDAGNGRAIQTEVRTLAGLGVSTRAYQMASQHARLFSRTELDRLRADKASADVRRALAERRQLDSRFLYAHDDAALRAALAELDANLAVFHKGSAARRRTQWDRVLVLRKLGRMHQAIAAYRRLRTGHAVLPAYVQRAAADAYLDTRHPRRAAVMYGRLIAANPGADVEIFISRYYALVESEDYAAAGHLLARIYRETPFWQHGAPGRHRPNWERVDVDLLRVYDAAYRRHEAVAERRARALMDAAPANTDPIDTLATIQRWRGWPLQAERTTALAAAYEPHAKATRLNQADDARDLGEYRRWHALIVPLARDFPTDTTIRRSLATWNDRSHASMSAQFTLGRSRGHNTFNGNRDRQLQLRLNSPWNDAGWRAYAQQFYSWGDYDGGAASINRVGVGAEWRWSRKHAWAVLSDDRFTGRHGGLQAGWSQWLDDRWQYRLVADSYAADTPLRAVRNGLHGRSLQATLNWRASESRSASFDVEQLRISDGNVRTSIGADFTQRVQASAHHLTEATLHVDSLHDSRRGGAYFNPTAARSLGLGLRHDWITWRRYQRSLTQHFGVSAGPEWQSGHGSAIGVDLQYGQTWKLSRTWSLDAGIGWGSHVYDGDRERRVFASFGLAGVF